VSVSVANYVVSMVTGYFKHQLVLMVEFGALVPSLMEKFATFSEFYERIEACLRLA
jgi:hypothetical protein